MLVPWWFLFPVVGAFCLLVLAPILHMVLAPVLADPGAAAKAAAGVFEVRQAPLILRSLGLGLGTTGLCLAIGVPFAFACTRTDLKLKTVFLWACIVPVLIPPYIHAIAWMRLDPFLEQALGFDIHSLPGSILVLTVAYFPFVILLSAAGLTGVDAAMEEASLLHHGGFRTLTRITLPLAFPHIAAGALFVFVFSVINISVPDFLRVTVYPLEIFIQFSAFYDPFSATLLSIPLLLITMVLIGIQEAVMKQRSFIQIHANRSGRISLRLGRLHGPVFLSCLAVILSGSVLPVAILIREAGPPAGVLGTVKAASGQ
ncbi:MAG: ABC transporter permease subunit, partial [Pseudomonadota bacterium]